ncbi:cobalamin biosynthesis protein CobQ [Vibrio splendidus]|uniref:cobalamin biosynthesis protein CobQ n=1 Tax=Vibrio splendidus TaxID=29497 RepID=UPI00352D1EA7
MSTPSIEFFPVDNGDMTLITTKNKKRILIDCNYRQPSDDVVDVKSMLRERLDRNDDNQLFIDAYLITHPDQDHTRGFKEIFHTGSPDDWKEKDDKIIINELWSSPRVFRRASRKPEKNGNATNTLTDDAKAINTEAKRRANLYKASGTVGELGDRIVILTHDEDGKTEGYEGIVADLYDEFIGKKSGLDDGSIEGVLLGPADRQDIDDEETTLSKNNSSAIVRFTISDEQGCPNYFLNGGDAEVKCWERLYDNLKEQENTDFLEYDVLQAPHHCSWHSLSEDSESKDTDPQPSKKAINALGNALSDSFIVSSSRQFGEKTPPSPLAREEYENILDNVEGQFLCVADEEDDSGKPTSLLITFENGKAIKSVPPVVFSTMSNPKTVKKEGKNTYA